MMRMNPLISFALLFCFLSTSADALSSPEASGISLDRFRPSCPADPSCIHQFDPSLTSTDSPEAIWVAVYRSNNNKPSVFVRDEFFHSMNAVTSGEDLQQQSVSSQQKKQQIDSSKLSTPMALEKPVAVARLSPSLEFGDKWVLDSLRCHLKKEDLDDACDGGSEFVEALSVCVDSLLLYHLKEIQEDCFEGPVRTKSTLYSNKILEERGLSPVEELSKDMATHVSRYYACLDSYDERTASTNLNPGARERALQMVSLLGKLDQEIQKEAKAKEEDGEGNDDQDGFDPWATIKMQI